MAGYRYNATESSDKEEQVVCSMKVQDGML